ncbi:MAG: hypothetical protein ACTS8H_03490 [Arsenophonus sp. NC-PE1-MAG3]
MTYVAPGTDDTDAVNLYQLKKIKRTIDKRIAEVDKIKITKSDIEQFQNGVKDTYEATIKNSDNAKSALEVTTQHLKILI